MENNKAVITVKNFSNDEEVSGVELSLESSTSRARVFNIALKIATLNWQDTMIDILENQLDERILEIKNGKKYNVVITKKYGENKRTIKHFVIANNEERARYLLEKGYPEYAIVSIEEYVPETKAE